MRETCTSGLSRNSGVGEQWEEKGHLIDVWFAEAGQIIQKWFLSQGSYRLVRGAKVKAKSCPILCDPMDCSLWGSSIHGIFQARVLDWVALSFSRGKLSSRSSALCMNIPHFMQEKCSWELLENEVCWVRFETRRLFILWRVLWVRRGSCINKLGFS